MGKEPLKSEPKAKGLIYRLRQWTGFGEKKLWDFLELLIVPAVLASGAFYLEEQASNRQEQIATARYQQEALAKYFDQMTQLLLEKKLRQPGSEARVIARARTLSTLGELDKNRKRLLLEFLYEAKLISQNKFIVSLDDANLTSAYLGATNLSDANLSDANLSHANLTSADLSGANLSGAYLGLAYLTRANLSGANLSDAYLIRAYLDHANLRGANLRGTYLGDANLSGANLSGANLSGADLYHTSFERASNLTVNQVKLAKNWELAIYEPSFRQQLGLPPEKSVSSRNNNSTP